MALNAEVLKAHLNIVGDLDEIDAVVVPRVLLAATAQAQRVLGFALDDAIEFPNGTPADLEQAVLMLAAHLYENREGTLVGVSVQVLPYGVEQILDNYRSYTFG